MQSNNPEKGEVLQDGFEILAERFSHVAEAVFELNRVIPPEDSSEELPHAA